MRRLLVLTLLAACATPVASEADQEIIGGTRSIGMTATVLLAGYPPNRSVLTTCTAVVVSPTVLLTSAHCVDAPNHPNYLFGIFTGDDAAPYTTLAMLEPHLLPVTAVHANPQYQTQTPFFGDLGVVVLAQPLTAITPVPMQRTPISSAIVGMPAQIIGYGQTTYQQPNQTRFEAMTTVAAIENDTIVVGDGAKHGCLGDSGGPAIVDGVLVGVDSYGPTGCGTASHYRRVDMFLPFIDQFVPPPASPDAGPSAGGPDGGTMMPEHDSGGCSAGGSPGLLLAFALLGLRRRR
jgi:secreted trypsin-like serine protease